MTLRENMLSKKNLCLFLILTLGAAVIFYQFPNFPKKLSHDEVEFAKLALSLNKKPYTPYSSLATGHATLYFYIILLSFKIFGINNFALRFPAALFGALCPLLFYLVLRRINDETTRLPAPEHSDGGQVKKWGNGLLLLIIFITLRWFFTFARFGFEVAFLLFLELTSIYFLFKFLEKKRVTDGIFLGLFTGLAFNSYTPGRIFFVLILIALFIKYKFTLINNKQSLITAGIFLITILPLSFYLLTHNDIRIYQQNYLQNNELSLAKKTEFLVSNISSTALMFNFKGDVNGRHNFPYKPALNPILSFFFLSGMFIAIVNIKKFYNQFFLSYFILSVLPTLLTYPWENPNMLRTFTTIPSIIYFIGVSINFILNLKLKIKKSYLMTLILLVFFVSSYFEMKTYFVDQKPVFKDAFEAVGSLQDNLGIK